MTPEPVKSTSLGGLEQPDQGFREQFKALDKYERAFVWGALETGDYQIAAKRAQHKTPLALLARKRVRQILLLCAPSSQYPAEIARPFVLAALQRRALKGDATAAKTLLSLAHKEKPNVPSY